MYGTHISIDVKILMYHNKSLVLIKNQKGVKIPGISDFFSLKLSISVNHLKPNQHKIINSSQ